MESEEVEVITSAWQNVTGQLAEHFNNNDRYKEKYLAGHNEEYWSIKFLFEAAQIMESEYQIKFDKFVEWWLDDPYIDEVEKYQIKELKRTWCFNK